MTIEMGTATYGTGFGRRSALAAAIDELPVAACEVLAGTRGSRIGTVVQAPEGVLAALRDAGVVGVNGGLTVWGSAVAEKLQRDNLDRLFG